VIGRSLPGTRPCRGLSDIRIGTLLVTTTG